jgi:ketosteroid isomerase-like protein
MKTVDPVVSAFFSVWLLVAPLASAQGANGKVEQQISALSDAMIAANLKGDTDFYQKYYAEDAIIVHGNGKLFTKAQELADLKSGSLKYESIDVREKTIHVHGDTAVVHILLSFKGMLGGKPFGPIDLRRTVVWAPQQGSWRIVAWQVTRVENR